jgi:hypothetical protein
VRFLYLIQGKAENVRKYRFLNAADSELIGLSYDQPEEGFEFLPNSSFATGRNYLLAKAMPRLAEFNYFVFLDDDVVFRRGSFNLMQETLKEFNPAIGVPLTVKTRLTAWGIEYGGEVRPIVKRQYLHYNDEQYLALRRDVIREEKLLPYLTDWDSQSWFVCCLIQEALIQHYYYGKAWQFNNCEVSNDQHSSAYPHNLDFARTEYIRWMRANFPSGTKRPALYQTTWQLSGEIFPVLRSLGNVLSAGLRSSAIYRRLRGIPPW